MLVKASNAPAFQEVRLPSAVGASPLVWGAEIFLPGADGRAYLVDPQNGEPRAEPFVPPFDRARPTRWRGAALLDEKTVVLADDAGRVRRLTRVDDPRPRLSTTAEQAMGKAIVAGPVALREAVVLITEENQVRALASRDLSPVGAWPLSASPAFEPAVTSGTLFIADLAGGLLALGPDGRRLWSVTSEDGAPMAGPPILNGGQVVTVARSGLLARRSAADGAIVDKVALGIAPTGGPIQVGDLIVIPDGPGALRPWSPDPAPTP
jgi:outer membrane protein assembly factor BamB